MTILFSCLLFVLLAAGMSLAGMKLYVKPKEAMERVAGTGISQHEVTPRHPSLVFHDIMKRLGNLVPASPKDVTVMQRRLIRAGLPESERSQVPVRRQSGVWSLGAGNNRGCAPELLHGIE